MAVHTPLRFLFMRRLVSVLTDNQTPLKHTNILRRTGNTRTLSTASLRCKENDGDSSGTSQLGTKLTSRQAGLLRGRRPLSPLERVSRLLPQEALGPELMQLREQNQQDLDGGENTQTPNSHCIQEESGTEVAAKEEEVESHVASDTQELRTSFHQEEEQVLSTVPGDSLVTFGELLIAEYQKKRRVEFRKMFQLETGARLQSSWGFILHDDIAGKPAGCFLKTSRGVLIFIRRAALEDYVLYMKRGPAIAYPKVWSKLTFLHEDLKQSPVSECVILFSGCIDHVADDGCHRGRLCAGIRFWVRGHDSVPVQSRSAFILMS